MKDGSSKKEDAQPVMGFINLHVPPMYCYLRTVRQSVMEVCARAGLSEFDTAQLEMAVDEAGANIIEHSYGGELIGEESSEIKGLRLHLSQTKDKIVIDLYDHGTGFDFEKQPEIKPEHYIKSGRQRGLGMHIIRRFVDEVSYERGTSEGNKLRLVKYLP